MLTNIVRNKTVTSRISLCFLITLLAELSDIFTFLIRSNGKEIPLFLVNNAALRRGMVYRNVINICTSHENS